MIKLRIAEARSRSFQCDIAGCRNKTRLLITKRSDVASHPLHLCADCIRGLYEILNEMDGNTALPPSVIPTADESDVTDGETDHSPSVGGAESVEINAPTAEPKPGKAEAKPNRAKKAPAKKGGK